MQVGDRYGNFEMIFNEIQEEREQNAYNPCQEFRFNRGYSASMKASRLQH